MTKWKHRDGRIMTRQFIRDMGYRTRINEGWNLYVWAKPNHIRAGLHGETFTPVTA